MALCAATSAIALSRCDSGQAGGPRYERGLTAPKLIFERNLAEQSAKLLSAELLARFAVKNSPTPAAFFVADAVNGSRG
jgi:hypothetical protein